MALTQLKNVFVFSLLCNI